MKKSRLLDKQKRMIRVLSGVMLIILMMGFLMQGRQVASAQEKFQVGDTETPTPTASETATETATPTATETATETATPTETATATATLSITNTATATATATTTTTSTSTPTVTGTVATPTATGTITPNPILSMTVSPTSAKVNELLTFTISLRNDGTAPIIGAYLNDSFPSYLNVQTVTSTKGTIYKTAHAVQVSLSTIYPGETVVVVVPVQVNNTLSSTMTLQNIATLTASNLIARTTYVYYTLILTQVLPGTGELPVEEHESSLATNGFSGPLLGVALAVLLLGILFFGKTKKLSTVTSLIAIFAVLVIFGASCLPEGSRIDQGAGTAETMVRETATRTLMPFMPAYKFVTPEPFTPLPDYPIPTPVVSATQESGEAPDTSPVVRLVIPSLSLDAIVKYVPYDESTMTWLIEGLRSEIAWLGNTSWPGLGSNTALAGHITVKGLGDGPFRFLEDIASGEEVSLFTEQNKYTYRVREQVVVDQDDLGVVLPTVGSQLTLITCTGWDDELELYIYRRVVIADLVKTEPVDLQASLR